MHVLGISCYYHDAAAALLRDGMLVAAAEEERFSRKKHDYAFPRQAIDFCLKRAGIRPEDVDYVVFYEKPLVKFERILTTVLGTYPRSWRVFREAMISWFNEKLWIKGLILKALHVPAERVLFSDHHVSHAASAFFCSPFEEAAVLTVDGVGEWTTAGIGRARADWRGGGGRASSSRARSGFLTRLACCTRPSPAFSASRSTRASTRSWGWPHTASRDISTRSEN
jgi:carbamoyltransferase